MKAMIFAAGEGRRMRPLTLATPKPLLRVGERSLLEHQMIRLAEAGVNTVVINAAYLADQVVAAVRNMDLRGMRCDISIEEEPLETGGGLLRAMPYLGSEPFLLVNSDIWTDFDFRTLAEMRLDDRSLGHLVMVDNPSHNLGGDFCLDDDGRCCPVAGLANLPSYTFSGISLLRPELVLNFSGKREVFPLLEPLVMAMTEHRISGEVFCGQWFDVGTVERLEEVRKLHEASY